MSLFAFGSCFPRLVNTSKQQRYYSSANNPFIYKIHPEFRFFHSPSGNKLFARLNLQELMFAQFTANGKLQAKVQIKYFIYSPDDFEFPVDSADFNFDLTKQKKQTTAITYIPVKELGMKEFYIKIFTIDMLKRVGSKDFVYVNYENENSSQNFMTNYKNSNISYFRPYLKIGQSVDIQHNKTTDTLFVKYREADFPVSPPPYYAQPYVQPKLEHDSVYFITGDSKMEFSAEQKALYCVQNDTLTDRGMYILGVDADFPFVRNSQEMLNSLKYLCKNKEFKDLQNASNKKLTVDRFWIKFGGNTNRARELIRIYYNRVVYANIYFTSYKEGWKTDRGMIYIMFGTPKRIKKEINKEIWIYSDRNEQKILQFVFNRQDLPYSNNVFVLERSSDFMRFWAEAKRSWRDGKVYIVFR